MLTSEVPQWGREGPPTPSPSVMIRPSWCLNWRLFLLFFLPKIYPPPPTQKIKNPPPLTLRSGSSLLPCSIPRTSSMPLYLNDVSSLSILISRRLSHKAEQSQNTSELLPYLVMNPFNALFSSTGLSNECGQLVPMKHFICNRPVT